MFLYPQKINMLCLFAFAGSVGKFDILSEVTFKRLKVFKNSVPVGWVRLAIF